ncbi:MAG: hypothetical protein WDA20_04520 [Desulfuromonadales bacterium]
MIDQDGFISAVRLLIFVMCLIISIDYYLNLETRKDSKTQPSGASETHAVLAENSIAATKLRQDLDQAMALLATCFGSPIHLDQVRSEPITMTAYSSTVAQCDDTPHITASMQPVRHGIIAVSDDLVKEFGLQFGQRVLIPGHGIFEVQDRMHPRWRRTVDIWVADRKAALLFGRQKGTMFWVVPEGKSDNTIAKADGKLQAVEFRNPGKIPET